MKTKYLKYSLAILASTMLFSCNSFLDTEPDNRTTLDSEDKILKLLVSAYPEHAEFFITEMMSDNTANHNWNLSYEMDQKQAYYWQDIKETSNDTPDKVWNANHSAIAAANNALLYIEDTEETANLIAAKGEALMCRAFGHYLLANTFCMPYGKNSASELGITYMMEPETTVSPQYDRGTLKLTYDMINEDIERALPLINNSIYKQPKFHFNKKAAYAFAAQFNLLYGNFDKAIEYATEVLGSNPAGQLRNWKNFGALSVNGLIQPNAYINTSEPATLLTGIPVSTWSIYIGPYLIADKYSHSQAITANETFNSKGPWGNHDDFYLKTFSNPALNKIMVRKVGAYMRVVDPVAQTGMYHSGRVYFTTDETLLHRAEAYILKKEYDKGFADIATFMAGFSKNNPSKTDVIAFYSNVSLKYDNKDVPTVKKQFDPPLYEIQYNNEQEYLLHYLLHIKRILNLHEGQRWLDIKRYGITIYRRTYDRQNRIVEVEDVLMPNDLRRAIQLPPEALSAGVEPNPR